MRPHRLPAFLAIVIAFGIGLFIGFLTWRQAPAPALTISGPHTVHVGLVTTLSLHGGGGPISIGGQPGSNALPDSVDATAHGSAVRVSGDFKGPTFLTIRRGASKVAWRGTVVAGTESEKPLKLTGGGAVRQRVSCPGYRTAAKLMQDQPSQLISHDLSTAKHASIGRLGDLPQPAGIDGHAPRQPGAEMRLWRTHGRVLFARHEADGDVHIGLQGPAGHTIIAEVSDPQCLSDTNPFKAQLTQARAEAINLFGPSLSAHPSKLWVRVIGPVFFDMLGHGSEHAPNGAEIHSVLSIQPLGVG